MKKSSDLSAPIFEGKLNVVQDVVYTRPDGSLFMAQDFSACPSMAEQHTAHLSDLNYLVDKYKPDELAAYLQARSQSKREIIGHDFSTEPELSEAMNITYKLRMDFEALSPDVKMHFKNHVEFLKFIDNPMNQDKMLKLGLMTKREIQKHTDPEGSEKKPETPSPESAAKKPQS